jgi:SAM-dependent methyltransferase
MSSAVLNQRVHSERAADATFGTGGAEPYARALRGADSGVLYLERRSDDELLAPSPMDFARWNGAADRVDVALLASVRGPVLDVGCGPARMVRAAVAMRLEVLGLDVSPTAIELGRAAGLPMHEGSVFDSLPGEGAWHTVLLVDGNVGIGGDVARLLARCAELVSFDGEVVVELHSDPTRDHTYTGRLVDIHGASSESFPWAEVGLSGVSRRAAAAGLSLRQAWSAGGRSFCRLAKSRT